VFNNFPTLVGHPVHIGGPRTQILIASARVEFFVEVFANDHANVDVLGRNDKHSFTTSPGPQNTAVVKGVKVV
jgi:hypothetical protein